MILKKAGVLCPNLIDVQMSYAGVKKRGYERIAIDVAAVFAKTFSA